MRDTMEENSVKNHILQCQLVLYRTILAMIGASLIAISIIGHKLGAQEKFDWNRDISFILCIWPLMTILLYLLQVVFHPVESPKEI